LQGFCLRSAREEAELSVYRRGKVYWYEFTFRGQRLRESTGLTNKTSALRAEAIRKSELAENRAGIVRHRSCPRFEDFVNAEFLPYSEKEHQAHPRICGIRSVRSRSLRRSGNCHWMQFRQGTWRDSKSLGLKSSHPQGRTVIWPLYGSCLTLRSGKAASFGIR
jgi:hypothetical protein